MTRNVAGLGIRELFNSYDIPFIVGGSHRHVRHGWIGVDCPWCGPGTNKYHLGIHEHTHAVVCWKCGHHALGEVVSLLCRIPIAQAISLVRRIPRVRPSPFVEPTRGKIKTPTPLLDLQVPHRRYLEKRGFDPNELVSFWRLRALKIHDRLSWRIWIPVHFNGEVVSWTTRSISETTRQRYIHARPEQESLPIKTLLYGWDFVRASVIICEGPTDVWRIGPGAVATFGIATSLEQVRKLSSVPYRIVCFDNEPIAQKAADKLCDTLSNFPGTTLRVCLGSKDPGQATQEEITKLRSLLERGIQEGNHLP